MYFDLVVLILLTNSVVLFFVLLCCQVHQLVDQIVEKNGNRGVHVDWNTALRTMVIENLDQTLTAGPGDHFLTQT